MIKKILDEKGGKGKVKKTNLGERIKEKEDRSSKDV